MSKFVRKVTPIEIYRLWIPNELQEAYDKKLFTYETTGMNGKWIKVLNTDNFTGHTFVDIKRNNIAIREVEFDNFIYSEEELNDQFEEYKDELEMMKKEVSYE